MKYLFAALNTLAVVLVYDIDGLSQALEKRVETMDVTMFFGFVKLAENVTLDKAAEFIFGMKIIMMVIIIYDLIFIVWEYKKSRDRLAGKR